MGARGKPARKPRDRHPRSLGAGLVSLLAAVSLSACGGDSQPQNASEPSGEFPVKVVRAKFPAQQQLAEQEDLILEIENAGEETIPDLAITIYIGDEKASGPFNERIDQAGVADPNRPVWILEHKYPKVLEDGGDVRKLDREPSAGAETAHTNTYAFGPLEPGESITAVWRVTPVKADTYTVHYEVAAGLGGKAKAVTRDGSPVEGEFVATISDRPPRARVTESGKVIED